MYRDDCAVPQHTGRGNSQHLGRCPRLIGYQSALPYDFLLTAQEAGGNKVADINLRKLPDE